MNIDIKQNVKLLMVVGFIVLIGYFVLEQTNIMLDKHDEKYDKEQKGQKEQEEKQKLSNEESIVESKTEDIDKKSKIEALRNRLKTRGLIVKGDVYLENEQLALALKKYLEGYKQNPKDKQVLNKLGDTYFKMKKFAKAYNYYSKVTEPEGVNKDKMIQALLSSKDLSSRTNLSYIKNEINSIKMTKEEKFFYINSLKCIEGFHLCKKVFNEYFEKNKEIQDEKLLSIKGAIENYRNFKLEEIYYKDALIVGSFFTNKLYPLSIILGSRLLETKKDYKPILKILGKSYFELGDYQKSKEVLSKYYIIDKEDPGVIYLIGIVNSRLHEYVLSNIYLNKALEKGYKPSIDVQRKLIHNYYLLGNTPKLLLRFKLLLEKEKAEKEDIQLAIYYHIINKDYDFAKKWAEKAIERFPENEIFYGYLGWIYKEEGEIDKAVEKLKKGLEINSRNSLLLLNMGYVEKLQGNNNKALVYFKKTVSISGGGEFGVLAKKELELMKKDKNKKLKKEKINSINN